MAEIIEELSTICGVSGNEDNIRKYIINRISGMADTVSVDVIGNVIAFKKGNKHSKKIMLASNMDESGFIVSGITEKGYLKIQSVGKADSRVIISKKVIINDKVKGIIGMKAIHLQKPKERESTVDVGDVFVDIGAVSKKGAKKQVSLGDYVSFSPEYKKIGSRIIGKALDRMGCKCLIDVIGDECEYDTYFVFAAQREIQSRGVMIAAQSINPDIAVLISTAESADMYGTEDKNIYAHLGSGAIINRADMYYTADNVADLLIEKAAKRNKINFQSGMNKETEAMLGAVQSAASGCAATAVSIPCRYSHTPSCMMDENDIDSVSILLKYFLEEVSANGIIE